METLPENGPHFFGAMASAIGFLVLLWVSRWPSIRARLGSLRWVAMSLASLGLLALGLLGNGPHGLVATGTLWSDAGQPSELSFNQTHVNDALDVALSEDFIAYDSELMGVHASFAAEDFESRLELAWGQPQDGSSPGGMELTFQYVDVQNVFYDWIGQERDPGDARNPQDPGILRNPSGNSHIGRRP